MGYEKFAWSNQICARQSSQAAHQYSKRIVWVHCLNCRKGSTKYLIQKNNKTGLQILSLVDGFFFEASESSVCLDNLHATESGADGAVVASGIAAQLRIHINSWMNIGHLLTIGTSGFPAWYGGYTCTHPRGNIFFRVGPNILGLFWNICSRGNVFYGGPNLTWQYNALSVSCHGSFCCSQWSCAVSTFLYAFDPGITYVK